MRYSAVLCVLALTLAGPALGVCNVPQPRLVCAEYFASSVVVEATLVKIKTIGDEDAFDYNLRANRVIRGHITGIFRVYQENNSGRASFEWKAGQDYLLFLFYSGSDKAWELDGCGNSGPLSAANAALEQIEAMPTSHRSGVIHGDISPGGASIPVSGVRVEARGAGDSTRPRPV